MRTLRVLGATALVAVVLVALTGAVASAEPTGGFGAAPAHPDPNDPATRAYFKAVLAPGQTYSDDVLVTSSSSTPVSLIVSAVDGLTGQTSGAVYANREAPVRKAGAWVTPSISALSLAPGAQTLVPFQVTVPADATPGEHLAGIAIEDANPQQAGSGQFAVTEVFRTVIGVLVTVPGPAAPEVRLGKLALKALPGTGVATLSIGLGDPGRLLVKPLLAVSLHGPSGYRRSVHRQLDTILPGDTIHYPFIWPDSLAAGTYRVRVTATGGVVPVTTTATLQLGTALRGATNRSLPSTDHTMRWLVLLGVVLVAALALAWLVAWRRRRPSRGRTAPAPTPPRATSPRARRDGASEPTPDPDAEAERWVGTSRR